VLAEISLKWAPPKRDSKLKFAQNATLFIPEAKELLTPREKWKSLGNDWQRKSSSDPNTRIHASDANSCHSYTIRISVSLFVYII